MLAQPVKGHGGALSVGDALAPRKTVASVAMARNAKETMNTCPNLLELFGRVYRVTFDGAYDHRHVPRAKLDPWMMQIPCRLGTVYPFGEDSLAVEVDYHPKAARELAALEGVTLHQDGDREKSFVFSVTMFDRVAEIVRPKRRRRLSPEQRAILAAHGFRKRQCVGMLAQADTYS